MDINFPLIMVVVVFAGAFIWLIDILFLAKARRQRVDEAKASGADEDTLARLGRDPSPVEYAKSFTPVLAIVLVVRSFMYEPFQIPSTSMVPTLEVGDFILVNKYDYGLRLPVTGTKVWEVGEPQRGDVMVFFPPHKPTTYFIKRVIGVPGDVIEYRDKVLYINGLQAEQTLLARLPVSQPEYSLFEEQFAEGDASHKIRTVDARRFRDNFRVDVRPGHYFMMGDNRDNSSDSRVWGQVPESAIVGKAVAVWMHWDNFFSLPSFGRAGSIE
ncbi:MAG TPA: signal peptidase I [Pseudomonadales bacterium]|nr:signal peptidase I [Pseudomonadales bacterium]